MANFKKRKHLGRWKNYHPNSISGVTCGQFWTPKFRRLLARFQDQPDWSHPSAAAREYQIWKEWDETGGHPRQAN